MSKKNKEKRQAMRTATIDHEMVETTPVTAVENEVLVGTMQPIYETNEEAEFEAAIFAEQTADAIFNDNLVDPNICEVEQTADAIFNDNLVDPNICEVEQTDDPVESYEELIHEAQIELQPIANNVSAVGEVHDLPIEPATDPQPAPEPEPTKVELISMIENIQSELTKLRNGAPSGRREIASGSKARPNVLYTLLSKPNSWHSTPQVAQLQGLLFESTVTGGRAKDGVVTLTEPELFAIIEAGKAEGKLRTKQPAVRIFQYYRNELLKSNTLRWA